MKSISGRVSKIGELGSKRIGSGPVRPIIRIVGGYSQKGLVVYNSGNNSGSRVLNIQLTITGE